MTARGPEISLISANIFLSKANNMTKLFADIGVRHQYRQCENVTLEGINTPTLLITDSSAKLMTISIANKLFRTKKYS